MTTEQLALDLSPIQEPTYERGLTLAERYEIFVSSNPHVIDAFEALTAQWLAADHKRVGMKAVAERCRWETGIRSADGEWKINNSFVSFISRTLLERHPEWRSAIATRTQKSTEPARAAA